MGRFCGTLILAGVWVGCEISGSAAPVCGDGVVEGAEACDDGLLNSDTAVCLSTCDVTSCGDGFVQAGVEGCDTGALNSDTVTDACRTSCVVASCGDGVVDTGEGCDDSALNSRRVQSMRISDRIQSSRPVHRARIRADVSTAP